MLAFGFVLLELALVTAARDHVASVFTSDPDVLAEFRGHIWYLFLLLPFDCVQCVQGGVTRRAGFQALGARTNLASYYLFGLPIGLKGISIRMAKAAQTLPRSAGTARL